MTINKWTELDGSRARYLSENTPSLEIREHAAKLYTEARSYDDKLVYAEDHGATDEEIEALDTECADAWSAFFDFCGSWVRNRAVNDCKTGGVKPKNGDGK